MAANSKTAEDSNGITENKKLLESENVQYNPRDEVVTIPEKNKLDDTSEPPPYPPPPPPANATQVLPSTPLD